MGKGVDKEPGRAIWRRRCELGVIAVLLLMCTLALVTLTYRSPQPVEVAFQKAGNSPRPKLESTLVTFKEEVSRVVREVVRHFDGSKSAPGHDGLIAVKKSGPQSAQVVAGPNQTILLRRGKSPHALYVLGENGYVVVSGSESRLVRLEDLRAMEGDAATVTR